MTVIPFKALNVYIEDLVQLCAKRDGHLILKYLPKDEDGVNMWAVGISGLAATPIELSGPNLRHLVLTIHRNVFKAA